MIKRPGFTLLELLVTIGVLVLVVGIAAPGYAAMQRSSTLNGATQEVADALRIAQTRALSAQDGSDFEVRILPSTIEIEAIATGSVQTIQLDGGVTLSATQSPITFTRLSGTSDTATTVTISNGNSKTVDVATNGQISLN